QNGIGGVRVESQTQAFGVPAQRGAGKEFDRFDLQVMGRKGAHPVDGGQKVAISFAGESGDEVEVQMDVPSLPQAAHVPLQTLQRGPPSDGREGGRQGRLNSDFELEHPLRYRLQQSQGLLVEEMGAYLEMEVGPL